MKLTEYLMPTLVKVPLDSADKTSAITELVDLLSTGGHANARDDLLKAVLDREAQRSTGIGRGFAIPHAKCGAVTKLVIAIGRTSSPMPFAAVDGRPVRLIALLASPPNATSAHIQALAKLSRLVTSDAILSELLAAESADQLYGVIARNDVE